MQASALDFEAACAVNENTHISWLNNGLVQLAGTLHDTFATAPLAADNWIYGSWENSGSYTPIIDNGILSISGSNGAWLRSQAPFGTATLDAIAAFGAAPWSHVGFGSDGFAGNRYALFSTFNTTNRLFVRTNNNGAELRTDVGSVQQYSGFHHYSIERHLLGTGMEEVRYFIDAQLVATHEVAPLPDLYVYFSHNAWVNQPDLKVDYVDVGPSYKTPGTYTSCALDAGQVVDWSGVAWQANEPDGTSLGVELRSSEDGVNWSDWTSGFNGFPTNLGGDGLPTVPNGRYIQYRLSLSTLNPQGTPTLDWIAVSYGGDSPVPPQATVAENVVVSASDQNVPQVVVLVHTTRRADSHVLITWIDGIIPEVQNYRVLRSETPDVGAAIVLYDQIVPTAELNANGRRTTFVDRKAPANGAFYWVESVYADGTVGRSASTPFGRPFTTYFPIIVR